MTTFTPSAPRPVARLAPLLLAVPLLFVVVVDARLRGGRLLDLSPRYMASYAAAMFESGVLWGLLLYVASARRGVFRWIAAVLFVTLVTVSMGGQIYFHRQYATYLNIDATLFGTSVFGSVFRQMAADGRNLLLCHLTPLVLAIALVWLGRMFLRPVRPLLGIVARVSMPVVVVAAFLIPCSYRKVQASTPDVIYMHAMGGLFTQLAGLRSSPVVRPGLRTPPGMPKVVPHPELRRNVVFILTESIRADAHCSAYAAECPVAPEVNAALPARVPLLQMRSNTSTTAIELSVIWSGLQPTASREALHTSPLLFDFAKSGGLDNAYWTSHHPLFANSRLYIQDLPTTFQCTATELDPLADVDLGAWDELLTERAKQQMPHMREPFFGLVHYGNTHVPYRVDPRVTPFQPSRESKAPGDNDAYKNFYRNAVFLQDRTIADLIRFIRSQPFGERTVIVFTSDHGEAFREHGQMCHTGSVFDEELHVPFWIDAPPGLLTGDEAAALGAAREELAFHTDIAPTILDLLGLWDAPELASYRAAMVGRSLLRPDKPATVPTLELTNCSGIWACAFRNWGLMRGTHKLVGREWDNQWHCYDVIADPREEHDLGPAGCGDLPEVAQRVFGGLPSAH